LTLSAASDATSLSPDGASSHTAESAVDLTAFFELSVDLLSVAGFDGYYLQLNQAWETILGFRLAELYAAPVTRFIHSEDREATTAELAKVAAGAEMVQFVNRVMHKDGSFRWISWTASAQIAEEQIFAVGRDVTQSLLEKQELRKSEEWFRALVDAAPNGIVIIDEKGIIVLANRLTEKLFGYAKEELIGEPIEILIPEALRSEHVALRDGFIREAEDRPVHADRSLTGQRRDGSLFPAAVGLTALRGEEGTRVSATIIDMTEQKKYETDLMEANELLESRVADLQALGQEADLISEMGEMLQSSQGSSEAHSVIELFAGRLFAKGAGAVGLINQSRNLTENVVTWGASDAGEPVFEPGDCWALRRGKRHVVGDDAIRVVCPHLESVDPPQSICLPLLAQGEELGVLTLLSSDAETSWMDAWPRVRRLSSTFADHLALALANLRLRETLQIQSIRDPITGLFNRRYLEESLEREVARAERRDGSLGVIMLDLDHFKEFNDTHGHRAGDAALVALGGLLPTLVRGEDVPCRYGGEEFAVIFPDAPLEHVARRAEEIREALAAVDLRYADRELGHVTVSAGVAAFPDHGRTPEDLILAADRALYEAKNEGRNRVVVAGS